MKTLNQKLAWEIAGIIASTKVTMSEDQVINRHVGRLWDIVVEEQDFELNRVLEWLQSENREPANTKFTAGATRNLAREIEFLLKK